MQEDPQTISWLLGDEQPAVRYFTLVDLLDRSEKEPEVQKAYKEIPKRGWAAAILAKQKSEGYWESRGDLYRPKYTATNWMALILSDLGLNKENLKVKKTAKLFFNYWLDPQKENVFKDEVCIVGNTARMLTRFGYEDDPRVKKLFQRLVEDQKEDGGWHCWESSTGTLDGWEALAAFASLPKPKRNKSINRSIERGAEFYLSKKLLEEGEKKYLPWYRLHYPVHYYYDFLVGLEVITSLGYGSDPRLALALELHKRKRSDGKWSLEKIHPDPRNFSWGKGNLKSKVKPFSLEKETKPSKWITLRALRVLKSAA